MNKSVCLALASSMVFATCAFAQKMPQPQPMPVPMPPPIPQPLDKPYVGPVTLNVNVTNINDRIEHVHEVIPVVPGSKQMILLYPQWIPGDHEPDGPIKMLGGIITTVDGQRVQWVRDRVDMYAFHVPLPAGAKQVGLDFDYLSPIKPSAGRIEMDQNMADIEWNEVLMYPAGYFSRDIPFDVTLQIPDGWKYATALETASDQGSTIQFEQTTLNTLVDSPLYTGRYFARYDLSPTKTMIMHLDVFADKPEDVKMTPEQVQLFRNLTNQEDRLFYSHHFKHYDYLLLLSNVVGGVGLEHHQSSEDGLGEDFFTKWDSDIMDRDLLAHESTHSWNGKFRRPNDLWTPNFNVPMRDNLLWVYEGMTQYWGNILTARSGLRTPEQVRQIFAHLAANFAVSPGRDWRPLIDTTNQPIISQRTPVSWVSWQRPENYYNEGALIWLSVDTKIMQLTDGKKSLDNFCKRFFGIYNGSFITDTYDFNDIVKTLNEVVPYDWASYLRTRIYDLHPAVPTGGFTQGGYQLIYNDTPVKWMQSEMEGYGIANFNTSLGLSVYGNDGYIGNVWWNSPAFKAGLVPDTRIISVNGQAYSSKVLTDAILAAEKDHTPIQIQYRRYNDYKTVSIPYYGGLRIPHLERIAGTPDYFDQILAPSKAPLPSF